MKNSFIVLSIIIFFEALQAENLLIQSQNIKLDKKNEISIFQNEVYVQTDKNHSIKSDFAEYDKKKGVTLNRQGSTLKRQRQRQKKALH